MGVGPWIGGGLPPPPGTGRQGWPRLINVVVQNCCFLPKTFFFAVHQLVFWSFLCIGIVHWFSFILCWSWISFTPCWKFATLWMFPSIIAPSIRSGLFVLDHTKGRSWIAYWRLCIHTHWRLFWDNREQLFLVVRFSWTEFWLILQGYQ